MAEAIKIQDLVKVYNSHQKAIDSVSYTVEVGDFCALLGANGAGKTTTINIITGLVPKTSGNVSVLGYSIDTHHTKVKELIGVVPQEFNFGIFETPEEILYNQAGYYGITRRRAHDKVEETLTRLSLWEKRSDQSKNLSGGMKRRLMIARAMMNDPRVLILDEPTAGVDVDLRRSMWEYLQEKNKKGMTILLTTHYLEEAEQLCNKTVVMAQGKIVAQGSVSELLAQAQSQFFVCDVDRALDNVALETLKTYNVALHADLQYICEVEKGVSLNDVFTAFTQAGARVTSIRPRANRMEEFFMQVTK